MTESRARFASWLASCSLIPFDLFLKNCQVATPIPAAARTARITRIISKSPPLPFRLIYLFEGHTSLIYHPNDKRNWCQGNTASCSHKITGSTQWLNRPHRKVFLPDPPLNRLGRSEPVASNGSAQRYRDIAVLNLITTPGQRRAAPLFEISTLPRY